MKMVGFFDFMARPTGSASCQFDMTFWPIGLNIRAYPHLAESRKIWVNAQDWYQNKKNNKVLMKRYARRIWLQAAESMYKKSIPAAAWGPVQTLGADVLAIDEFIDVPPQTSVTVTPTAPSPAGQNAAESAFAGHSTWTSTITWNTGNNT